MLELYTHPLSSCAQKVRIVLAEKGLEWVPHHVNLPDKGNLHPEYLRLNPRGVVPTLVHDGVTLIESTVICEYLEDVFPAPPLRPDTPDQRAAMRLWMRDVDIFLHPACSSLQWALSMRPRLLEMPAKQARALLERVVEKPRRERQLRLFEQGLEAPDIAEALAAYQQVIADLDQVLRQHAWVVCEKFTLADASLAPYFQILYQYGWLDMLNGHSRVADWYARCRERISYRRAVDAEFPDDVMIRLHAAGAEAWPALERHLKKN